MTNRAQFRTLTRLTLAAVLAVGTSACVAIYRDHGYFPPQDADALIDMCHAADVRVPAEILRRFVTRYIG